MRLIKELPSILMYLIVNITLLIVGIKINMLSECQFSVEDEFQILSSGLGTKNGTS